MPSEAVLVISPHAGRSRKLARARRALDKHRILVAEELEIKHVDRLPELLRAPSGEPRLVIAAGGDGTVGSGGRLLAGADNALGILPLGTGNDFARSLDIPLNARRAARLLVNGEISSVDLGRLTRPAQPLAYFAHAATVGLNVNFAKLATRASVRGRLGRLTYLVDPEKPWPVVDGVGEQRSGCAMTGAGFGVLPGLWVFLSTPRPGGAGDLLDRGRRRGTRGSVEAVRVSVEVVGKDRPAAPGLLAGVAGKAAAAQLVAAFEVADAALSAGAVAVQASAGAGRVGLLAGRRRTRSWGPGCWCRSRPGWRACQTRRRAASSRIANPSVSSLASVPGSSSFSPGFPGAVVGGRM